MKQPDSNAYRPSGCLQNQFHFNRLAGLNEVREITYDWIESYNERRPHKAYGGLLTVVYLKIISREVSLSLVYS